MQRTDHPLPNTCLGQHTTVTSLRFGAVDARPKAYLQASLHADELPAMLAAHHLRALLERAEHDGRLRGQVVLVPVANPIGLAQRVDHRPMGRFDLGSSENFNRHYPDLPSSVWPAVRARLGPDAAANVATVRAAVAAWIDAWRPATPLEGLRHTLVRLAHDADLVLDLHCDCEAVVHLYTENACADTIAPLARLLGARAVLLASGSGVVSFDECLSGLWWRLAERLRASGDAALAAWPLPQACASATVELRGEADVTHALAAQDAAALFAFLQHAGVVEGAVSALPAPACAATPLAGSQTLRAPVPGVLVFRAEPGQVMAVGDPVADLVDPISGTTTTVHAEVAGVLYARRRERFALPHDDLAKIAGASPMRSGNLLSA